MQACYFSIQIINNLAKLKVQGSLMSFHSNHRLKCHIFRLIEMLPLLRVFFGIIISFSKFNILENFSSSSCIIEISQRDCSSFFQVTTMSCLISVELS